MSAGRCHVFLQVSQDPGDYPEAPETAHPLPVFRELDFRAAVCRGKSKFQQHKFFLKSLIKKEKLI
jgi:hypothetical protein